MCSSYSSLCPVSSRLLSLRRPPVVSWDNEELRWSEKAVVCLVRRLRKTNCLNNLLRAVMEADENTECVTIQRSNDGRLQICQRKVLPHVLCCKLWRFPDIQSHHELRALERCEFAFHLRRESVCVNPFHYSRVRQEEDVDRRMETTSSSSAMDSNMDNLVVDNSLKSSITTMSSSWCSVTYYEFDCRVGDTFRASTPTLFVDGFTDPSNCSRFCLGLIANVNRAPVTERTRQHIGRGLKLFKWGDNVYVECLSKAAIFVHSEVGNARYGWQPHTVCKLGLGGRLRVFSETEFASRLSQHSDQLSTLSHLCTVRISFVKGWGSQYTRPTIMATPCWIEIHLHTPLQWLDRVLLQRGNDNKSSYPPSHEQDVQPAHHVC